MSTVETILEVNGPSAEFVAAGYCDILVEGLTAGAVKLQYLLPKSTLKPAPAWTDFPGESYTTSVYKTIFISRIGVRIRLLGVGNNVGVYVNLASDINR